MRKVDKNIAAGLLLVAQALVAPATAGEVCTAGSTSKTELVLLGTAGGPIGNAERAGIASLLKIGGRNYLVDAGDGVSHQLAKAGFSNRDVSAVFLTHLHDDHTAGLPGLVSFAYTTGTFSLSIIGPPRTTHLTEGLLNFLDANTEIRMAENKRLQAPPSSSVSVREVQPGMVYKDEHVRVTAARNTHMNIAADHLASRNASYAYRFDTADAAIAFTGDTSVSEAVEELARGADILVAEMVSASDIASVPPAVVPHMLHEHLTARQVGELAARAKVGTLVLSHVQDVPASDLAEIRKIFSGEVVLGSDLARFNFPCRRNN